jgi:hypothetical protein
MILTHPPSTNQNLLSLCSISPATVRFPVSVKTRSCSLLAILWIIVFVYPQR